MSAGRTQATRALHLTSSKNPLLKEVRRAAERGTLTEDGLCIAETFHLLEEALRSDCEIPYVIAAESVLATVERRVQGLPRVQLIGVPDELMASLSATQASQGVMALVRPHTWEIGQLFRGTSLVMVLDGIQDPGNAGAVLRAAEAFGATGAIFLKGSVNAYNPKTVRASAGSVFRLPLVALDETLALAALTQRKIELYAAMPRAARSISQVDLSARCAFIIGSEGRGVSPGLAGAALDVRIPMSNVESLNAAVAAGILLYEAWRQRQMPS